MMPLFPRSSKDPTGEDKNERKAMAEYARRIRKVREAYEQAFKSLRKTRIYINGLTVNRTYLFDISATEMEQLTTDLAGYTDVVMGDTWLYSDYVQPAYLNGTIAEYTNLARQSKAYATQSLNQILFSNSFRRRESYVKSRVFEEMKKLSAQVRADMTLTLTDAVANGYSIQKTVDELKRMEGINEFRANRIARTEITTALKRAHLDEAEQASIDYGIRTMQMQFSALSPTTRIEHANRHGKLYTPEEVRDWMSKDANSINCKCTFVTVLVDDDGNVVNKALTKRIEDMRKNSRYFDEIHVNNKCDCGSIETDLYMLEYNNRLTIRLGV